MKKFLSILLVVMLVLSMIPATVSADPAVIATFNLGANGTASHNDGSEKTSYSESNNGYTLSITGGTKMYTGARDQKGNGCIKLGTSSKAGSFTISNIPDDIVKVVIHVAAYKAKTATVTVNGTKTSLTTKSDNGQYNEIIVDTSSTKSVSFAVSSGYRAMVNTIEFMAEGACGHENTTITTVDATCTVDGSKTETCDDCGETVSVTPIPAGHSWNEGEVVVEATCTEEGELEKTCSACATTETFPIAAKGHSYVNGTCTVCGESQPTRFEFGANGAAGHYDGSEKTSHTETCNGYTLSITGGTKMYTGAKDEKGNSCIKLGTGSAVGEFSFAVPDDVTQVKIYVAGYKANNATVTVNGKTYTITTHSNDGEYTEITVDTADVKTVTLATKNTSDERAMVNSIEFICENVEEPKGFIGAGNTYDTIEAALKAGVYTLKPVNGAEILDTVSVTIEENGKNVPYTYAALYLEEDEAYTYYSLNIRTVNIRSKKDGMYFTANVKCDPKLADRVESYGVVMSLKSLGTEGLTEADYAYTTTETETGLNINESIVSGGVFGIFKNGADNASRGDADVHAKVYLKLKDSDTVLTSVDEVSLDFLTALGKLNDQLKAGKLTLSDAQRTELQAFGQRWSDVLSSKGLTSIPGVQAN